MGSRGFSLLKRGGDSWRVSVSLGVRDDNGRYRYHRETIHARTKREAALKAEKVRDRVLVGFDVDAMSTTVREWVQTYLDARRDSWADATYYNYNNKAAAYIYPRIGDMALSAVTRATIDTLYANIMRSGGASGNPVSGRTVRQVHNILNPAFRRAVRHGVLPYSPCDSAELPRERRREKRTLQAADVIAIMELIDCLDDRNLAAAISIGLETGMRRCEVCGLQWRDVSLGVAGEGGSVHLRRAYKRTEGSHAGYGDLKTEGSVRTIALTPTMATRLATHKVWQSEWLDGLGGQQNNLTPVVMGMTAMPMRPDTLTRLVRNAFDGAGLKGFTFHSLRHTQASFLLSAGTPVKAVQQRLGHASAAMTLDVYGHAIEGQDEAAASTFERVVGEMTAARREKDAQLCPDYAQKQERAAQNRM